jgi:hypothetical protein
MLQSHAVSKNYDLLLVHKLTFDRNGGIFCWKIFLPKKSKDKVHSENRCPNPVDLLTINVRPI